MTLNLFQFHFQLPAFIIKLKCVHQILHSVSIETLWGTLWPTHTHTHTALEMPLNTSLLCERTRSSLVGKTWQTEMDGDSFLSSQHLSSEPSFLFLHFNKLLFTKMLLHCLIGMQDGTVLIFATTQCPFTYAICLTLLPFP